MYRSVIFIILLVVVSGGRAFADRTPDVSSLFYVREVMSSLQPLLLLHLITLTLVVIFLANAVFAWLKLEYRIKLLEAFTVKKIIPLEKHKAPATPDSVEFKSGLLEDELLLGGRHIYHRGLYILGCGSLNRITLATVRLMEKIIEKWRRPVLYSGKKESALLKDLLDASDFKRNELKRFENILSRRLFMLPILTVDPDIIHRAVLRLKNETSLGAVLIEDIESNEKMSQYWRPKNISRLSEVSNALGVPIFVLGSEEKGGIFDHLRRIHSEAPDVFNLGEIKCSKDNEIYVIFSS